MRCHVFNAIKRILDGISKGQAMWPDKNYVVKVGNLIEQFYVPTFLMLRRASMLCTLNEQCAWGLLCCLKYFTWSKIIILVLQSFTAVVWSFYFTSLNNSEFDFFWIKQDRYYFSWVPRVQNIAMPISFRVILPISWWSYLLKNMIRKNFEFIGVFSEQWIFLVLMSCFQLKEKVYISLWREKRILLLSPKSSNAERKNSEISCVAINSSRNWYVQRCIPTIPMIYVL